MVAEDGLALACDGIEACGFSDSLPSAAEAEIDQAEQTLLSQRTSQLQRSLCRQVIAGSKHRPRTASPRARVHGRLRQNVAAGGF
jgi:hypothetical protein